MAPLGWVFLVGSWGLLLLFSGGAKGAEEKGKDHQPLPWLDGEFCRSWEGPRKIFWCPGRYDGMEAKYCCGTCSLPYCCSSKEDRLDPKKCPPKRTTPQPPQRHSDLWPVSFFIIMTVGTVVGCLVCFYCIRNGGDVWASNVVAYVNQKWTRLRSLCRRSPSSPPLILDCSYDVLPPAYSESPPPSYSEEDSPRAWEEPAASAFSFENPENPDDEAGVVSLVHRNVPGQVLESSLEAESSV